MEDVDSVLLFAFIGEDEFGSGKIGLKQAFTRAGFVPLVAVKQSDMENPIILDQLRAQADKYGKTIRLCRFKFDGEIIKLEPLRTAGE